MFDSQLTAYKVLDQLTGRSRCLRLGCRILLPMAIARTRPLAARRTAGCAASTPVTASAKIVTMPEAELASALATNVRRVG